MKEEDEVLVIVKVRSRSARLRSAMPSGPAWKAAWKGVGVRAVGPCVVACGLIAAFAESMMARLGRWGALMNVPDEAPDDLV